MATIWKYKIDLSDENCFEKYEKLYGFSFPIDLKEFIIENNASYPDKKCIMFGEDEHVVDSLLSFNETEDEADTFCDIYDSLKRKDIIPFARDPFGNYYYYFLGSCKIGYYSHEDNKYIPSDYSLKEFIDALYEAD